MKFRRLMLVWLAPLASGCSLIPEVAHEPRFHNPFPQFSRVAVLPFYNLSDDPTVDQDKIALAYYNELQRIPGFEVMPVGVAKKLMEASNIRGETAADFQRLAGLLGVDAVIVGAVTEYSPYYPPRMGLAVNWYAANPFSCPIPPGCGLPWGTSQQEYIPESLVFEAEFAAAREQSKTRMPEYGDAATPQELAPEGAGSRASLADRGSDAALSPPRDAAAATAPPGTLAPLPPPDYPTPRGFLPPPTPNADGSQCRPYLGPIITHTSLYNGHDQSFTERLANYFYFRDDVRFGGWQAYLQRSDDFIRFCCYLHLAETLAARGGAGQTRVVWRWPNGRYEP